MVKFVKKKSDITAALLSFVGDYTTPQELSIKHIRADSCGRFEGELQGKLDQRSITHEHTPPDTPQYNGVAERALGLLQESPDGEERRHHQRAVRNAVGSGDTIRV